MITGLGYQHSACSYVLRTFDLGIMVLYLFFRSYRMLSINRNTHTSTDALALVPRLNKKHPHPPTSPHPVLGLQGCQSWHAQHEKGQGLCTASTLVDGAQKLNTTTSVTSQKPSTDSQHLAYSHEHMEISPGTRRFGGLPAQ